MLKQNPRADVGLHFAITSEWDNVKWRPLTDCSTLKNEDGYFYPMLFKNKFYPGQAIMDHTYQLADIEKEMRAASPGTGNIPLPSSCTAARR
jgi:predicted glycoside hydrolase/deacetylase ChbG (UPF0249 family)